ncbi:cyclic nucleotide-gated ion channel [Aureococcus anophagefferens]|nr:cyclic nucleotide-gated ion channel [Aureococcus anophagefferens]
MPGAECLSARARESSSSRQKWQSAVGSVRRKIRGEDGDGGDDAPEEDPAAANDGDPEKGAKAAADARRRVGAAQDALLATDEDSRKLATTPEMLSTVSLKRSFAVEEGGPPLVALAPRRRARVAGSGLSGFAANARAAALNVDAAAASSTAASTASATTRTTSSASSRRSVFGGDGVCWAGGGGRRKRVGRLLARLDRGLRAHVSDPESAGQGILELEKKTIWRHHVESKRLTFDLLTCAPYEIFALFVEDPALRPLIVAFARLPKARVRLWAAGPAGAVLAGAELGAADARRRRHRRRDARDVLETLVFICIAAGMSINAMIIGQITAAIADSDASSTELSVRADRLEKYMQQHRVPLKLRSRVNAFMNSLTTATDTSGAITNTASGESLAASTLPHTLRARVCVAIRLPVLTRCPIFESCTEVIKRAIALYLMPETYSEGDLVIQFGDHGEAMHFLLTGTVQVVAENNVTIYATLKAGCYFGEGALFSNVRRTASIQCTCFSESLRLSRSDLQAQLKAFCFPQKRLLEMFNTIRRRNADTNAAISKNLTEARELTSRLSRVVDVSPDAKEEKKVDAKTRALLFLSRVFVKGSAGRAAWETASALFVFYEAVIIPRAVFTLPDALTATVPGAMGPDYAIDVFFLLSILLRPCATSATTRPRASRRSSTATASRATTGGAAGSASTSPRPRRWSSSPCSTPRSSPRAGAGSATSCSPSGSTGCCASRGSTATSRRSSATRRSATASGVKAEQALFAVCVCYGYVNHWYACVWFAIHRYLEASTARRTWATEDSLATPSGDASDRQAAICRVNVADCYIRAVHMVITTISSVGYGDIKPVTPLETCWQLVVVVTGACLFASLIGAFTLILEAFDTEGVSAFNAKLQRYEAHMRRANLPPSLRSAACPARESVYAAGDVGWDVYFIFHGSVRLAPPADASVLDAQGRDVHGKLSDDGEEAARAAAAAAPAPRFFGDAAAAPPAEDPAARLLAGNADAAAAAKRRAFATAKSKDGGPAYTLFSGVLNTGEHFGEFCLQSGSGVRQETAITLAASEFYTISRTDLEDQVVSYESDDVLAMFNDLLQVHKLQPGSPGNAGAGESP